MPSPEKQVAIEALCDAIAYAVVNESMLDESANVERAAQHLYGIIEREKQPEGACPDGDACPDARRYGDVHPGPKPETAEGLLEAIQLRTMEGRPAYLHDIARLNALIRAERERVERAIAELDIATRDAAPKIGIRRAIRILEGGTE